MKGLIRSISLICFLVTVLSSVNADDQAELHSISGGVKILVGTENYTPQGFGFARIRGQNVSKSSILDSLGYFKFDSLKTGTYSIEVEILGTGEANTIVKISDTSIEGLELSILIDCSINKDVAEHDIRQKSPRLLILGGIAPVIYSDQHVFEDKYKVKYFDYGCISPGFECMIDYNKSIFEYLDSKYGIEWQKEIRGDVAGIKDWQTKDTKE